MSPPPSQPRRARGRLGAESRPPTWAPPRPTFHVVTDPPDQDAYEVLVNERKRHRRLVAAVEIVSPANKDRPENRCAFVTKCDLAPSAGLSRDR